MREGNTGESGHIPGSISLSIQVYLGPFFLLGPGREVEICFQQGGFR